MTLLLGSALFGLAVSIVVFNAIGRSAASSTLVGSGFSGSIGTEMDTVTSAANGANLHEILLARSRSERVVKPWLKQLNALLDHAKTWRRVDTLHDMAQTAGLARTWTHARITVVRMVLLAIGVSLGALLFFRIGGAAGALVAAISVFLGWRGFDVFLTNRARIRQEAIVRALPDVADQISITVAAGLSLEQAIRRTVSSTEGPLSDEFARFLHDVRLGQTRRAAFMNLQERVDVQGMTSFVRAVAQAEKSGVSVAEILQIQADELREGRRQRAEERAMRLPVLMLMPLVGFILPPLLIVLIGPVVIDFMESGGFGGI